MVANLRKPVKAQELVIQGWLNLTDCNKNDSIVEIERKMPTTVRNTVEAEGMDTDTTAFLRAAGIKDA